MFSLSPCQCMCRDGKRSGNDGWTYAIFWLLEWMGPTVRLAFTYLRAGYSGVEKALPKVDLVSHQDEVCSNGGSQMMDFI